MKIKLRFYSEFREITGKGEMEIEIVDGATIRDVMELLKEKYPEIREMERITLFSLNHRYARIDDKLKDGDELAIFPPVEGG